MKAHTDQKIKYNDENENGGKKGIDTKIQRIQIVSFGICLYIITFK